MAHTPRAGRNDACPCGSGKKFKKCCAVKPENRVSKLLVAVVVAALAGAVYAGYAGLSDEGSSTATAGKVWSPEHGHYH